MSRRVSAGEYEVVARLAVTSTLHLLLSLEPALRAWAAGQAEAEWWHGKRSWS